MLLITCCRVPAAGRCGSFRHTRRYALALLYACGYAGGGRSKSSSARPSLLPSSRIRRADGNVVNNRSLTLSLSDADIEREFKALVSVADVARLLDVNHDRLIWHLWRRPKAARFSHFEIRKRRGGIREISAPNGALKIIQAKLARVLSVVYRPGASAHGFIQTRGILTNGKPHVHKRYVLNLDIEDFFPSIHFGRLRGLLKKWPYNCTPAVATTIAQVCFAGEIGLPQGAPTSPVVANMMCAKLDAALSRLAQKHRCSYTRYSDDITISTTQSHFPVQIAREKSQQITLSSTVEKIFAQSGFPVHATKRHLHSRFQRQEVTGLVVNEFVNVRRRYVRQVRAMLHAWEKFGEAKAEDEFRRHWDTKDRRGRSPGPSFYDVLHGKLTFLGMVRGRHDQLYTHLVGRARNIDPRFGRIMTRDDAVLVLERDIDLSFEDNGYSQGSSFLVEGIGLVTASHVVAITDGTLLSGMNAFRAQGNDAPVSLEVVMHDPQLDVAIALNPYPRLPRLRVGDASAVRRGDKVLVLGFPHWKPGNHLSAVIASVAGHTRRSAVDLLELDIPIQKGTSGGPVLNLRGEVVGLAQAGSEDGSHANVVSPISAVIERAAQLNVDLARASAGDKNSTQLAKAHPAGPGQ